MTSPKILGIDPGTGICGFGVIQGERALDFGVISTPARTPLPDRLLDIYDSLRALIAEHRPDAVAIEKLFFKQNITTGITVAEARGVIILATRQAEIPIFEYAPNEIKKTLTGYGMADKRQMQEMVRRQLNLEQIPKPDDAADALAVAITHALMKKVI